VSFIIVDGKPISFEPGMSIIEACRAAGIYVPHLCWNPHYRPHGSCRLCTVRVGGREVAACITRAEENMEVENNAEDIVEMRRTLLRMLFVEGNHVCPACEKSGACQLQAVAYYHGMLAPSLTYFYPPRPVDASHPDVMIDFNRCILCELCVRASRETDGKNVFSIGGRGIDSHLMVNSLSGRLVDSDLEADDRAAHICPVGAILPKHRGYETPIGERLYDRNPVDVAGDASDEETPGEAS
jgi:[NiFe] hydrogenase diaphorase moiety small subunit